MSPRGFVSLLAVTALSVVAAGFVIASQPDITATSGGDGPMLPELNARLGEVSRLVVEHPGYRLELEQRNGAWVASDRGDYPVRSKLAADLVGSLAAMRRIEPKTASPDWHPYIRVGGPDAPVEARGTRVAVLAEGGDALGDVVVGKASSSIGYSQLGGTFIRPSDDMQSWLVEGTVSVPADLPAWFDQLFSLPGTEISRLAILSGDTVLFAAEKPEAATPSYELRELHEEAGVTGTLVNDEAIRSLLQAAVSVTIEDVRARGDVTIAPEARTVRFVKRNGLQLDATLAEAEGEETWIVFDVSAPAESDAAGEVTDIASRIDNWAFLLPQRRSNLLAMDLAELVTDPAPASAEPEAPEARQDSPRPVLAPGQ